MALDYNTINGLYTKYLGRSASQDEATNWANGTYGSDPFSQIPQSGEAQAFASKSTGDSRDTGGTGAAPGEWYGSLVTPTNPWGTQTQPVRTPTGNDPGHATPSMFTGGASTPAYTPTLANAPAGFDQTKWADPTHTSAKYVAGRIIASGGSIQAAAQAVGGTAIGNDKIQMPNGDIVDAIGDVGGANTPQWLVQGAGTGSAAAPVNLGGGPTPGGFSFGSTGSGGGFGSSQASALYDILLKRAQQPLTMDSNDPIIRNQTDAYSTQQQRASKNYLSAIAEKAGPNANIGAETRIAGEQTGLATSQFQATLMGQELAARRQEIESALSGAAGFLTQEQQMQLQYELQQIANAQQLFEFQQSQSQQESQFGRTLANNAYQFDINDQYRNSPLVG